MNLINKVTLRLVLKKRVNAIKFNKLQQRVEDIKTSHGSNV